MSVVVSSITISDNTLKEQANLRITPQKEVVNGLLERLQSDSEEEISKACDDLAHKLFIPWLNKQNIANKLFFCKQGGVKLLVKLMVDSKSTDIQADAGTAVWNFAESSALHQILWREGAGPALLEFLKSGDPRLERVAIGALFGLLDYGSGNQQNLTFSPDRELVKKILEASQDTWSFSLAKTGCLLSLSKYPSVREELLSLGGIKTLQEENPDILISYLQALGLAHLIAEDSDIDPSELIQCQEKIEKQFLNHPIEIRKKESRHGVVWSSTKHLLRLLKDKNPVVQLFGLYSYANLSYGDYNRSLMLEEDVLGAILCSQWSQDGREEQKKLYIEIILKNFGANLAVPSLFHIGQHQISTKAKLSHLKPVVEEIFPDFIVV